MSGPRYYDQWTLAAPRRAGDHGGMGTDEPAPADHRTHVLLTPELPERPIHLVLGVIPARDGERLERLRRSVTTSALTMVGLAAIAGSLVILDGVLLPSFSKGAPASIWVPAVEERASSAQTQTAGSPAGRRHRGASEGASVAARGDIAAERSEASADVSRERRVDRTSGPSERSGSDRASEPSSGPRPSGSDDDAETGSGSGASPAPGDDAEGSSGVSAGSGSTPPSSAPPSEGSGGSERGSTPDDHTASGSGRDGSGSSGSDDGVSDPSGSGASEESGSGSSSGGDDPSGSGSSGSGSGSGSGSDD